MTNDAPAGWRPAPRPIQDPPATVLPPAGAGPAPAPFPGQSGWPASPYQHTAAPGYGTPPPRKTPTGLIVGVIVALVVLGVTAIVVLVVYSGADENPAASAGEPTSAGPTASSSGTPVAPEAALTLQGDGYTYRFPNGEWKDLTAEAPDTFAQADTVAALGDSLAATRGNIVVATWSAYGATDVDELTDSWKSLIERSTGITPVDIEPRTIGGKEAVGVKVGKTNPAGVEVQQVGYLVISGDNQYYIAGNFAKLDTEFEDMFQSILDTWTWQE